MTARLRQLVPNVWVATSRWYATTSTVLLDGAGGAVVVDPAFLPDELAAIPRDLVDLGVQCVAGLATHEHYDHVLWHPELGDVPRWSSRGTVEHLGLERPAMVAPLAAYLTPDLIDVAGRLTPLADGTLPWRGPRAECIEHDAHAPAHLAVLLPDAGILVAGDMLSDVELPMPNGDQSLEAYGAGLDQLEEAVRSSRWVVPGHGTPSSVPLERFDADRRYVDELLAGRTSDDPRVLDPENAALHGENLAKAAASRSG
jgi:glyoxylase-like metal-dependent hydrolase (beta-lactamase superfamily II)